ncbi:hypothetical protein A6D6_03422 [Alcanivorax xiamenensis]|uniref:Type VI secretion system secreted protein VgrG n=2 Tax=Alcanivorax xiamenensis TaxID=1177156 RepID=A0ABQ6Y553_9GAMM|nr:hypothetical protein A6D6_03422 [Alcanivorax xiamenensis]
MSMLVQAFRSLINEQHNRLLRLKFPHDDGPDAVLLPEQLDAVEGLCRDFSYTVTLISDDAHLHAKNFTGRMVTLELVRKDGSLRYFNGYVFEFSRRGTDGGYATYEIQLGPWLSFLKLRKDNYLFQNQTVADQTAEVFADYPLRDYRTHFIKPEDDAALTFAMQWDESDYNYLHRRWEERGWYYWYEHRADGHTLVLSDDSATSEPVDGSQRVRYHKEGGSRVSDAISEWFAHRRLASTAYSASSFNFKNPQPQMASAATVNEQGMVPDLEVYEYAGAYGFKARESGEMQSRRRMEEIEAHAKVFQGEGDCSRLQPGRWFGLVDHFDHDVEEESDHQFLVVEAHHQARNNYLGTESASHYENRFQCLRKKVPWRPGRGFNSQQPKLYGLMTATVVGPSGEEIYCDEYGRVRLQFHFDREGQSNEASSCWVRVASNWAGERFGFMAVPRIGQEVLVQFLDGDPDKPIITGRVYNQANMPPWDLPANKTQTGILTRSSQGGGYDNANAIRFEDKKGEEQLWIHAEKNQDIEVENDETHWVGQDRVKTIDRDETSHIKRDRIETVDRDETITVHNNRTERVDQNETISIGANRTEDVGDNENVVIGGNQTELIKQAKAETVALAKALTIGGAYQVSVGAAMNTTVGLSQSEQVGINKSVLVGKRFTINVRDELAITVGKSSLVMKSDGTVRINGVQFEFGASGPVHIIGKDVDIN